MSKNPSAVTWRITCDSRDESERLARFAREEFPLDKIMSEVIQGFPNDIEVSIIQRHRLSDFFRAIEVSQATTGDESVFWISFRVSPEANHYWKDLAARILHSIHDAGKKVLITLDQAQSNK
jgi:hypothetical protein